MSSLEATFRGKVAVITGAASGIGRALAEELAASGCHLALSDIKEADLANTVRAPVGDVGVLRRRFDVAVRADFERFREEVLREYGRVDLVFNNAGVGLSANIVNTTFEDYEWIMGINFWGVLYGTKLFLPDLLAQDSGHIVNISSVLGLAGAPTQSGYSASKFAVRGLTESLRWELRHTNVKAHCVHPGGIKTGIVKNGRMLENFLGERDREQMEKDFLERATFRTANQAAKVILEGIVAGRERILVGPDAYFYDGIQRTLPSKYGKALFGIIDRFAPRRARS